MSRSITSRCRQLAVTAGSLLTPAVLLAGVLAGCGAPAPELGSEAARQLQSQVLAVSEAAAANDPAGSLKLLDALVTELDQAAANGDVSFKRHQSIRAAIDAVRAELIAKQAAAELPPNRPPRNGGRRSSSRSASAAAAAQPAPPRLGTGARRRAPRPKAKGGKGEGQGRLDAQPSARDRSRGTSLQPVRPWPRQQSSGGRSRKRQRRTGNLRCAVRVNASDTAGRTPAAWC